MILASLRDLAKREKLVDDPAFESKPVRWQIALDADGRFLNAYDTNGPEKLPEGSRKKPKLQAKMLRIPRRLGRTAVVKSDFLVDNAKYALGFAADPAEADNRLQKCHAAFVELLRSAPQDVPELRALLAFLANAAELEKCEQSLARQGGFASNDLFCFEVDGGLLANIEEMQAWWRSQRERESEAAAPSQCLVCGHIRVPARLHNSFQIRGASSSGVPLVSFNAAAFEKYGLSGNENAPVCTECMTLYTEALRRLTRSQYETPAGTRLQPLNMVLNDDTTAVYWSEGQSSLPAALSSINTDPSSVRNLLESPHHGSEFILKDTSGFYCLILTGAQGRAAIRKLHVGTVGEVAHNLRRYFQAIQIGKIEGRAPLPLTVLLRSIVFKGELRRLPGDLGVELLLSALFGAPLSRAFLQAVVTRIRVEPQDLRQGKSKVGRERAALLQLYFSQKRRSGSEPHEEFSMGLNEETDDRAYVFGRVLAVAERMQQLAQPQGLNRTLVDRFFAMASVRPQVVYAQLLTLYQYQRRKAMRDKFSYLANKTDELWGQVQSKLAMDSFGKPFGLEEQARFGLGYYHQKQKFIEQKQDFIDQAIAAKAAREECARNNAGQQTESNTTTEEITA